MNNNTLTGMKKETFKKSRLFLSLLASTFIGILAANCMQPTVIELDVTCAGYSTIPNSLHICFSPHMPSTGSFYLDDQLSIPFDNTTYSEIFDIGARTVAVLYQYTSDDFLSLEGINPPIASPFTLNIYTDHWLYYDSTSDLFKSAAYKVHFKTASIVMTFN